MQSSSLKKLLLLQAHDDPEFGYDESMKAPTVFFVRHAYPYRWITIEYGDYAMEMFKDGELPDLQRALAHEMMHIVLDELNYKHRNKAKGREWSDSLESTIEHLTNIIVSTMK